MDERLIYINIGWMKTYRGDPGDPTLGGHGYLRKNFQGHETWNFLDTNGRLYGYIPRSANVLLVRLGADRRATELEDVTVVWLARSPIDKRTYVVGWYRGATVGKKHDHYKIDRPGIGAVEYQITAPASGALLLPPDQRTFRIPTAKEKGNLGQSPIWYGNPGFNDRVREYLAHDGVVSPPGGGTSKGGTPKQPDPLIRKLVELAAVQHAVDHYTSVAGGSRTVRSVEKDGVGWDLEVVAGDTMLKVEVKGLSGSNLCVELTPNEHGKMQHADNRAMYVVYVVTEALTNPRSHVFYYNAEASKRSQHVWQTHDGLALKIDPLIGARLTIAS